MNERRAHEVNPDQREITDAEKEIFIAKAREKAPFDGQSIDDFGTYKVNYNYGTGYTTIYVPGVAESLTDDEDDMMMSDALAVMVRDEFEIDARYTQITMRQYIVHLTDMVADYDEVTRVFDAEIGDWAASRYAFNDMKDVADYHDTRQQLGVNVFTRQRFDEVCAVLNQLDPANRW